MKRRLLIIAFFLLLGAVVNVAVAWGCALWQPWPSSWASSASESPTQYGSGFSGWSVKVWRGQAWARVLSRWTIRESGSIQSSSEPAAEEVLPSWAASARPSGIGPPGKVLLRFVESRGWPTLAMRSEWETEGRAGVVLASVQVTRGYLISSDRSKPWDVENPRVMPLRPIWPGFALNTLFYAALLWLLIPGPFALRRFLRLRRGLCPKCAYPMGESGVCTECGGALARHHVA